MPIQGGRSFDIIRQVTGNVINIFNKRPMICTAPCDGMVLRMHYQWTFWCMLGSFSAIWFSWFHRDVILCASHYNADTQVRMDYVNICLSYPFLQGDNGTRRYILFYRWVHWVLLITAALYYIPHKISKTAENSKLKKLFEDLSIAAHRYDGHSEKEQVDRTARYFSTNLHTHNGLFFKYLICNFLALIVDVITFRFFDFVFQGRFLKYGIMTYPFSRNVEDFDDYMSQTFPPFVRCELGETYQLTNKRHEILGCHLTVMELYEKIFFVLWIWLIFLTCMTLLYICYLFFLWLPWFRLLILRIAKPYTAYGKGTIKETIIDSISNCKIGDVYLLYRLRQHFSHASYLDLLRRLADPSITKLDSITIDHNPKNQDLRQRNKNPVKSPSKFQDIFSKPESRFLPNSSILVE